MTKSTPGKRIADLPKVDYDLFAPYYDHYMKHVEYDKWTDKILEYYNRHTSLPLKDILELACGTANISQLLVKMGYNVTASDRSERMLKEANKKQHKPHFYQADMLAELPSDTYDLVLLIFDSINYLLKDSEVLALLANVNYALRKNGLFIFDISTLKNSRENFNGYINLEETSEHLLIHRADFDVENRAQVTKLTVFKKENDHYLRLDEEHKQRIYQVSELLSLAEQSPLHCVGIYSLFCDQNLFKTNARRLDYQYSRLFFVLQKV